MHFPTHRVIFHSNLSSKVLFGPMFTVVTSTSHVPVTVDTIYATYRKVFVPIVNQDGLG